MSFQVGSRVYYQSPRSGLVTEMVIKGRKEMNEQIQVLLGLPGLTSYFPVVETDLEERLIDPSSIRVFSKEEANEAFAKLGLDKYVISESATEDSGDATMATAQAENLEPEAIVTTQKRGKKTPVDVIPDVSESFESS